jgi:hypothetical protein
MRNDHTIWCGVHCHGIEHCTRCHGHESVHDAPVVAAPVRRMNRK